MLYEVFNASGDNELFTESLKQAKSMLKKLPDGSGIVRICKFTDNILAEFELQGGEIVKL